MSIKIMSRVWEHSKQGGSQLLLLLAIADNANDIGFAWPGQKYLAKKIRMSARSIPRLTTKLQASKELFVHSQAEAGGVTQYIVTTDISIDEFSAALAHMKYNKVETAKAIKWIEGGVTDCHPRQSVTPDTAMSGGVDIAVSGGVDIAVSTEPSLTVSEPFLQNSQNQKTQRPRVERQALNCLGAAIAHSGATAKTTDALRDVTLIGYEIAKILEIDIIAIDATELKALVGITIRLSSKGNIKSKLPEYQKWWYAHDWRGKQGQPPTIKTMGLTWGQFEADKVGPKPSNGPVLSDEQKARLAELSAGQ